MNKQV